MQAKHLRHEWEGPLQWQALSVRCNTQHWDQSAKEANSVAFGQSYVKGEEWYWFAKCQQKMH